MIRFVAVLVFALVASLGGGGYARAQSSAEEMLPPEASLGEGWTQIASLPATEELDRSFRDAAYGVYGGPDGSRAVVQVFLVAEGMTAIRESWEVGGSVFDFYRGEIDYGFQFSREEDLADEPMPAGCADERRLYGVESIGFEQFPVGLSLCAADPDIIIFAYVSGTLGGLNGYRASDAAIAATLTADMASPEPGA